MQLRNLAYTGSRNRQILRREWHDGEPYGFRQAVAAGATHLLDIGANVGLATLSWLEAGGKGVVCVEPDTEALACLRKNLAGKPVDLVAGGLGQSGATLRRARGKTSLGAVWEAGGGPGGPPAYSFCDLFERATRLAGGDPRKVWVKLDCEGAEAWLLFEPGVRGLLRMAAGLSAELHASEELRAYQLEHAFRKMLLDSHSDFQHVNPTRAFNQGRLAHLRLARDDMFRDWPVDFPAGWLFRPCLGCPDRAACADMELALRRGRPATMARRCSVFAVRSFLALAPRSDLPVLEVGYGRRRSCQRAVQESGRVWHGVEASKGAVRHANEFLGTAAKLPFAANTYGLVLACQTMEHWAAYGDTPAAGLREMHRVAAPGARLQVLVPLHDHGDPLFKRPYPRAISRLMYRSPWRRTAVIARGAIGAGWPPILELVGEKV